MPAVLVPQVQLLGQVPCRQKAAPLVQFPPSAPPAAVPPQRLALRPLRPPQPLALLSLGCPQLPEPPAPLLHTAASLLYVSPPGALHLRLPGDSVRREFPKLRRLPAVLPKLAQTGDQPRETARAVRLRRFDERIPDPQDRPASLALEPTARSAMKLSSVSSERWEMTVA